MVAVDRVFYFGEPLECSDHRHDGDATETAGHIPDLEFARNVHVAKLMPSYEEEALDNAIAYRSEFLDEVISLALTRKV